MGLNTSTQMQSPPPNELDPFESKHIIKYVIGIDSAELYQYSKNASLTLFDNNKIKNAVEQKEPLVIVVEVYTQQFSVFVYQLGNYLQNANTARTTCCCLDDDDDFIEKDSWFSVWEDLLFVHEDEQDKIVLGEHAFFYFGDHAFANSLLAHCL